MDKVIKEKWLKALRSGRYKQGKGYLKRGDKYCCLDVLCKVQRADFSKLDMKSLMLGKYDAGISNDPGNSKLKLAQHNDGKIVPHWNFKQIADWVEKNL